MNRHTPHPSSSLDEPSATKPQPVSPCEFEAPIHSDRWLELDLYWFDKEQMEESANVFWERFAPLMAQVTGWKGVIINAGWLMDSVLEWNGDLVLIRPEDAHSFSSWRSGDAVRFINFAFRPEIWERIRIAFFPGRPRFFDKIPLAKREFSITGDDRERLRLMAGDLASGHWNSTAAAAFLHGVLALLANRQRNTPPHLPDWLAHALRRIATWPHFVGGVPEFVHLAGRSHEHVSRDCRRLLDTTPHDIVNGNRLKWAAMLLETTDKKITDIAGECGFDHLGHFYGLFRAAHQMTPRSYRLQFGIRERE